MPSFIRCRRWPLPTFGFPNIMVEPTRFVDALRKGVVRYIKTTKFIPNLDIREVDGDGNCFWSSISVRASFLPLCA
jgi:hypothetical protein